MADDEALGDRDETLAGPPSFFPRLLPGADGRTRVEPVAELAWSLAGGDSWPVFVQRLHPPREDRINWLKRMALAARRHAENRICLGPHGELDLFFNDRGSLERFRREIGAEVLAAGLKPDRPAGPVKILACRGLLSCPWAAVDSLAVADRLAGILAGHRWSPEGARRRRRPPTISIRGCRAGRGLNCGVIEYADLALTGRRLSTPVIDQDIVSLSPRISELILGCPGQALKRSHLPKIFVELDPAACDGCGWCVAQDPAFRWPEPQGGHLRLEVGGRRQAPPWEFLPARALAGGSSGDLADLGSRILELLELWRAQAADGEILADFAERLGLLEKAQPEGE
jgi:dissimilatory sulfite reductase (desulfoviridin) alpha/beta subunit